MSLVRMSGITKRFAGEPVLERVDFRVEEGEKIGLIGRNGTGKSTLFRLILREHAPDEGEIECMRKARFAHLAQLPKFNAEQTIRELAGKPFEQLMAQEQELRGLEARLAQGEDLMAQYSRLQEQFDHAGGYDYPHRIERVLSGLGFSADEYDLSAAALSGGQRTRLLLALVLLEDADLLLLDEPENHLDLQAREWLERFLRDSPRAFVIISHDRRMLDAVVDRVVEVERATLTSYTGNYTHFVAQKALRLEQQAAAHARQQRYIEKEQAWIDRFRYKATKARQAQSRVKRLDKLERIDAPVSEQGSAKIALGDVVRSGTVVLKAEDLSMAYGDLQLYKGFGLEVTRGERIGIIGPNGSGKTTLLRHLAGRPIQGQPAGKAEPGHKVALGFYDQHHEGLNRANDILKEINDYRPDLTPEEVRSFMGRFLFTGEDIFKPIATLSGGELGRVSLAKLILSGSNVLLLDEPTNHLDIATREVLEGALESFQGTLILVSHDRTLIDLLADRLIIVSGGQAHVHLGNYSHYRETLAGQRAPDVDHAADDDTMKVRRGVKGKPATKPNQTACAKARRKQQRRVEELENDIAALEEIVAEGEARFGEIDPADYEALQRQQAEVEGFKNDLRERYAEWEDLASGLEAE